MLLLKGVYGADDAPFPWYLSKKKFCAMKLACKPLKRAICVYVWINPETGVFEGELCWHVDDFMSAGTKAFHYAVVAPLAKRYGGKLRPDLNV